MNLNELKSRGKLLNWMQGSGTSKAIEMAQLFKNLNRNRVKTDPNYKAALNEILKKHYTLQNKFQYLEHAHNSRRPNLILKLTDWNLIKTNANYRALYNRVASKVKPANVINEPSRIRTRPQQGGTCWFHAIINGLLLSPRPREILKTLVKNVEPLRTNTDVCPMKRASRDWFLKYIKHRLQQGGAVSNVFRNKNVIHASGLRGFFRQPSVARRSITSVANTGLVLGGNRHDLIWFYKTFFPGDFTNRNGTDTPLFVMQLHKHDVPHDVVRHGVRYELTHAWISFSHGRIGGHALAGYKHARGPYRVYDSGNGRVIPTDWTKASFVSDIKKVYGESVTHLVIEAIYMKT
jgi:hypothetical protein